VQSTWCRTQVIRPVAQLVDSKPITCSSCGGGPDCSGTESTPDSSSASPASMRSTRVRCRRVRLQRVQHAGRGSRAPGDRFVWLHPADDSVEPCPARVRRLSGRRTLKNATRGSRLHRRVRRPRDQARRDRPRRIASVKQAVGAATASTRPAGSSANRYRSEPRRRASGIEPARTQRRPRHAARAHRPPPPAP
jgi:hypothetical protein